MKRILAAAALAAAILIPSAARADEIARDTAAIAALDAVDLVTTRAIMRYPGGYENNPIARPLVRSNGGAVVAFALAVLAQDVIGHALYRHNHAVARTFVAEQMIQEAFLSIGNMHTVKQ